MKKLFAVMMALCLALCAVSFAEETAAAPKAPVQITPDISFGMSLEEVQKILGSKVHEKKTERTRAGLAFTKLEVEDERVNTFEADVDYLFLNGKLAAVKVDFEGKNKGVKAAMEEKLNAEYGAAAPVDPSALGKAVYAIDDDGEIEGVAEAWNADPVVIVLEQDHDGEVEMTAVDVSAIF